MKLTVLAFVVLVLGAGTALAEPRSPTRTLSVHGEASIKVPADWMSMSLTVETSDDSAQQALEQNSRLMAVVRKKLIKEGVTADELATGSFSIQPMWEPRPRQADSEWRPRIIGYQVRNQLNIESAQLALSGQWIQTAIDAGASGIGQIRFSLADAAAVKDRAASDAISRARRSAEVAAKAAGVKLVALVELRVDGAAPVPVFAAATPRMEMSKMSLAAMPEISPGEIEVHSRVDMRYQITD